MFPIASYHMLKHDVKVLESVFNPLLEPDEFFLESPIAKKAYAAYDAIPKQEAEGFQGFDRRNRGKNHSATGIAF